MKKILSIISITTALCIFTGTVCALVSERTDDSEMNVADKIAETVLIPVSQENFDLVKAGAVDDAVSDINENQIKISDIQTVYNVSDFSQGLGILGYGDILNLSSKPRSLYSINKVFPVEYINQIDDETAYAVYKTNIGDDETTYLYLFFEKLDDQRELVDEQTETWWLMDRAFFAKKALQYCDFSDIKAGSSIFEVNAVDPLVNPNVGSDGLITEPFNSYHLLKDGVLRIQYAFDETDNIYRVTETEYVDTFEIQITENGKESTVCEKINEGDYPPSDSAAQK